MKLGAASNMASSRARSSASFIRSARRAVVSTTITSSPAGRPLSSGTGE